ncbi:Deoxyadenosine kinase [compost metagenome]
MVKPPDLMIYLKASIPTLVDQIQKRGRLYEDNIRLDYLKRLNEHYNHWVDKYKDGKLLVIDIDNCNYADNTEDFAQVISKIDAEINGLF